MKPIIHVSNSFTSLRMQLTRALFFSKTSSFQKKILILSDLRKKHELMREFAKEVDIVLGLDIMEIETGLTFLVRLLYGAKLNLPPFELLALHIFPFIEKFCTQKNRYHFAKELAVQFLRYGRFGAQELADWKKKKGWQQTIWNAVFSTWDTPAKLLDLNLCKKGETCEIHLYHFPFLPPIYHKFFEKIALVHPVHYYQFSPCMEFWTDTFSEKERLYVESKVSSKMRKEWNSYLSDRPLLLAHFGGLARRTFSFFEKADFPSEEGYVSPVTSTMLGQIQHHILHYEKKPTFKQDDSVVLHSVTSKKREVEALYSALLSLDVSPSKIRVYAVDISSYAPWIFFTFDQEESPFPFSISDLPKEESPPLIRSFIQLIDLQNQRFALKPVLQLLASPSLQRKFCLKKEEVQAFTIWMQEEGVKWGVDSAHRQSFFSGKKMMEQGESGTWEHSFQAILMSFAKLPKQPPLWRQTVLDFSEAEVFGTCVSFVRVLRKDLDFLEAGSFPLHEWSEHLINILNRYFEPNERELSPFRWIEEKIKALSLPFLPKDSYDFSPVACYLKAVLQKKGGQMGGAEGDVLHFSSLKLGAIDQARVICLLGLDENKFPRSDSKKALQELAMQDKPSAQNEDRHLFLEALFAARDRLILSYVSVNEQDGKEQSISPIVQEFLDFIHPVTIVQEQPSFAFHKDYFTKPNYGSQNAFYAAKQYYFSNNQNRPLIPEFLFATPLPDYGKENLEIACKDLERFAKHPLRFYLNHVLHLYLRYEDADDAFYLPRLNQFLLEERARTTTFDRAFQEAECAGRLPLGRFKEVAKYAMRQKIQKIVPCEEPNYLSIALEVPLQRGFFAKIKGSIFGIAKGEMLFYGEKKVADLIKIWPLYLSYACQSKKNTLFLTQTGERLTLQDPKKALTAYLIYYEKAQHTPSPFLPRWADIFLNKGPEQLAKKMQEEKDPYVRWVFRKQTYDPETIFANWAPLLRATFHPLEEVLH